jgi:hypothetical protein
LTKEKGKRRQRIAILMSPSAHGYDYRWPEINENMAGAQRLLSDSWIPALFSICDTFQKSE